MRLIALAALLLSAIFSTYVRTSDGRTPVARQTPTTQPLCIQWAEKQSTYSDGGIDSQYTTVSLCRTICVGRNNCTAFDFDSSPGKTNPCTFHFNADDLLAIHTHNDRPNSTQYIIVNRFCSTTIPSTTTTTTTTQSLLTVVSISTQSTTTNKTYTDTTKTKNDNTIIGVGVGVGVGGFFLLLIIVVVIVTCRFRRRQKDKAESSADCKRSKRPTKCVVDNAYATADELPRSSAVKSVSASADLSSSVVSSSALEPPPTPPPPRSSLSAAAASQPSSPVQPPPAPPLKPPRSHAADKPSVGVRRSAKIVRHGCDSVVPSDWNNELHTYTHHIPDANQSTVRHQTSFSNVAAVNTTYDELQFGSLSRPSDKSMSVYDDIASPRQPISEYQAVNTATVGQLNMQHAQLAVTLNAQPKKPTKV